MENLTHSLNNICYWSRRVNVKMMMKLVKNIATIILLLISQETWSQVNDSLTRNNSLKRIINQNISILKKEPQNLEAAMALVESFYRIGEYRETILYANVAEDIYKNKQDNTQHAFDTDSSYLFFILQTRGKARHKSGDYRKAEDDYDRALSINPHDSDLLVDIGNLYYNTQEYDSALFYFQSAEQEFPEGFKSKFNIANTHYVLEDYDSALYYYDKSITVKDDFPYAYFYKGTIFNEREEFDKAISEFDKALQIWPDKSEIYFRRGFAHQSLGDFEEALADWNMVILLDSTYFDAIRNRAITQLNLKDKKQALADLNYLIEYNEEEEKGYKLRGKLFYHNRKYNQARSDLEIALEKGQEDGETYYMLGKIYRKKRSKEKACAFYLKAKELNYELDRRSEKFLNKCNKD